MEIKEGTVIELGMKKDKYVVLSSIKLDEDDSNYLVAAPTNADEENIVIQNDKTVFLKNNSEGIEIVADKELIKTILNNI